MARKKLKKILVAKGQKRFVEDLGREVTVAKEKTYYIYDTSHDFHTDRGIVAKKDLAKKDGSVVKTNSGKQLSIFSPSYIDWFGKISRLPQTIPLKDIGLVIAETGIDKSSVVVDAGSGSGGAALFLAHLVKHVHTYEIRKEHADVVRENIEMLGVKNVTLKEKDVCKGIDVKNADLVLLDLPSPWDAVKAAQKALKIGGFLVSYSPMIPQVVDFVEAVSKNASFIVLKTVNVKEEYWEVQGRKVRPKSRSDIHSGFLTFARKIMQ